MKRIRALAVSVTALAISSSAAVAGCISFEELMKNSAGGTMAATLDNGAVIEIRQREYWPNRTTPIATGVISRRASSCAGGDTVMRLEEAGIGVSIVSPGDIGTKVSLTYCDGGPIENIDVQEQARPKFIADIFGADFEIADAGKRPVQIRADTPGSSNTGTLEFGALDGQKIETVLFGGASISLGEICVD